MLLTYIHTKMNVNDQFSTAVEIRNRDFDLKEVIDAKIDQHIESKDAFYVVDLGDIVKKFAKWKSLLPRVEPFYAVKCNEDTFVCQTLAALGTGFDCASKTEIDFILNLGVTPDRVVYANPCKQMSHIRFSADQGVAMMTFDNEEELLKVKKVYPDAKLILRLLTPENSNCQIQLGAKFGCHPDNVAKLLNKANELELDVIGISFHVGSDCYDPTAFTDAVLSARDAFDVASKLGFTFSLLDIGGGFPGKSNGRTTFEQIAEELSFVLDKHFPEKHGIRIIAEPGRYFVSSAYTLCVSVIGKRKVISQDPQGGSETSFMYYVNDGVYGSFLDCLLFDDYEVFPMLVKPSSKPSNTCSIWGPTCDSLDCIKETHRLPELEVGDYVMFENMGAYTMSTATTFNGMCKPQVFYVIEEQIWEQLWPLMKHNGTPAHNNNGWQDHN
ncbi:unnamed protein product [Owenia fusiformis]|uniref:Ornithine decarboxylase n=1 Tax=Owenia fusiformis TaxID=6347 RepID=A0A8S4PXG4_OWEFU|nr:unnamed protein product [Owenia fusiformis]